MARTHTFKGSASAGYGYFAYIEDGQLVIGEDWGREGGILYRGAYQNAQAFMTMLHIKAPKLASSIDKYYVDVAEATKQALAKAADVGVTYRFKDSRDSRGNGYSGYIKNGKLFLEHDDPRGGGEYFRGSYVDAKIHLDSLKTEDPVLYKDIEKYFTKHGVKDESDRKDLGGSKETKYRVKLIMDNGKELDAVISGTSETDVIRKIMLPVPDTVMMYDLEGRTMAVRSDKIYTVAILDRGGSLMKCVICGKEIEKSSYANKVLCSSACFHENFWNECLDEEAIIVNGECYHDGGRKPEGYSGFLGHAGREFTIKMLEDGRVIRTNNLWYNGEVPEEREVPDNAVFVW